MHGVPAPNEVPGPPATDADLCCCGSSVCLAVDDPVALPHHVRVALFEARLGKDCVRARPTAIHRDQEQVPTAELSRIDAEVGTHNTQGTATGERSRVRRDRSPKTVWAARVRLHA